MSGSFGILFLLSYLFIWDMFLFYMPGIFFLLVVNFRIVSGVWCGVHEFFFCNLIELYFEMQFLRDRAFQRLLLILVDMPGTVRLRIYNSSAKAKFF